MKAVRFLLTPRMHNGLLTLGISPASSTRLYDEYPEGQLDHLLDSTTLSAQGVRPGMRLMRVALDEESRGVAVSTFQEFEQFVKLSHGDPIHTTWSEVDEDGEPIGQTPYVELPVKPELIGLQATDGFDDGLFGLSPLVAVTGFSEDSANADVLHEGDLFLRLAGVEAPRCLAYAGRRSQGAPGNPSGRCARSPLHRGPDRGICAPAPLSTGERGRE
jgi:hypothetical protein